MTTVTTELIGAWRLISWSLIYDDGRPAEFPLGSDAQGMIMYTANGEVSATLMRANRAAKAPTSEVERATAFTDSFAYAGRYEVRDATVFHTIEIATNPALIGVKTTRRILLEGDHLTLSGPDFSTGSSRAQQIVWRRALPRT
jgi:hypothetical protein